MRRFPIEIFIIVLCVVMLALGWRIYGAGEMGRFGPAIHAQRAPSALYARLLVRYTKPPIYEEEYRMSDVEGISTFDYRIRSFNGHEIVVTAPPARVYDVSFFFGRLVQDGVWQLIDKAPRPDATVFYTVYVKQLADYKQGQRTVTFTDPQYWAHKAGEQFEIDLSKGVPKNLVFIAGQQAAGTRYGQIIADFRAFGPDEFRHNIDAAQARIRAMNG
jgi:hypothetical protein